MLLGDLSLIDLQDPQFISLIQNLNQLDLRMVSQLASINPDDLRRQV
jgi:hypothetical protein